jgi:choline-sulfatase
MDAQPVTAGQIRAARHAYYGAVSYVDDQFGSVLRALAQARLAEDTIVVLLADHGEMLGERGLWYKMSFFEPASRIPLLVHAPRRFAPGTVCQSVSSIDLLPTLAEIAGDGRAPQYATGIEGRSLLPHLERRGGHDEMLGEYLAEGAVAPIVMIRRGRHKFIHCPADPDQLYDLSQDPDELRNLAGSDPQSAGQFRAQVSERWSLESLNAQVLASQRRRRLVASALRLGRRTPWDYQPTIDASQQYVRDTKTLDEIEAAARFPRSP